MVEVYGYSYCKKSRKKSEDVDKQRISAASDRGGKCKCRGKTESYRCRGVYQQ
jgi:hypothetical protein